MFESQNYIFLFPKGEFLNDLDIHGNPISNKNEPLFQGFLEYSGLTL